jgi:hypothetical protein
MSEPSQYVVEYDNNSVAWLVDVGNMRYVPLVHGAILVVSVITTPHYMIEQRQEPIP